MEVVGAMGRVLRRWGRGRTEGESRGAGEGVTKVGERTQREARGRTGPAPLTTSR